MGVLLLAMLGYREYIYIYIYTYSTYYDLFNSYTYIHILRWCLSLVSNLNPLSSGFPYQRVPDHLPGEQNPDRPDAGALAVLRIEASSKLGIIPSPSY